MHGCAPGPDVYAICMSSALPSFLRRLPMMMHDAMPRLVVDLVQ